MTDPLANVTPLASRAGNIDPAVAELSEDAVSRVFSRRHGRAFLFDHDRGAWFHYDGDRWREDRTRLVLEHHRTLAHELSETTATSVLRKARSSSFISGAERLSRSDPALSVTSDVWDASPDLVGCPGGMTLDLRSGQVRDSDPNDRLTKICGATPDPANSPCPLMHEFLMQVCGGDDDLIHFLQILAGYSLTGHTKEQILLFVCGPGGNGKSVLLDILGRLLGDYAKTAPMDAFVASRGDKHATDLAMLRGARLVTASETEEGRSWAESKIKALTGGDTITARFIGKNNFSFKPEFKLVIAGNHMPTLRNVDAAIRRRFLILPMTYRPRVVDPDLVERIWQEAPQILAWAVRGALEWQSEGLPRPAGIVTATDQYFTDMDQFGEWLSENCSTGDARDYTSSAALFSSWRLYAEQAGERPGTQKALAARFRRLGLVTDNRRVDGKMQRCWVGIRLKSGAL